MPGREEGVRFIGSRQREPINPRPTTRPWMRTAIASVDDVGARPPDCAATVGNRGHARRHPMKRLFAALALFALGGPLADSAVQGDSEDARLTALFKEYLEREFKHRPLEATRLGDHRFDHLLDDLSP